MSHPVCLYKLLIISKVNFSPQIKFLLYPFVKRITMILVFGGSTRLETECSYILFQYLICLLELLQECLEAGRLQL